MGRPPAVLIVARHGARLDAADEQWHLSTPTPYDPPLTYGGWTQCRALGARIAALLKAREELFLQTLADHQEQNGGGHPKPHKKRSKKHRVIIHTSPFLRCLQTSIAISAGISQHRGLDEQASDTQEAQTNKREVRTGGDDDAESDETAAATSTRPSAYFKPRLRIDAFLGEWLSPDYFESIIPPPGSMRMVADAKANLLRRGERIDPAEEPANFVLPKGNFPGGWGSSMPDDAKEDATDRLSKLSLEARNSAQASSRPPIRGNRGYQPPIPRSALSPSEPIPKGYVQHAREACIEVDYQWDSMRAPQDWGDGGEFGEEWSAMHRRFRKGLQGVVSWYSQHHESSRQQGSGGHARVLHPVPHDSSGEEDDEDTDLVLVLVTHGAGCNALIGALTNQPVLLDVGMASLTMAVRREDSTNSRDSSRTGRSGATMAPAAAGSLTALPVPPPSYLRTPSPSSAAYSRIPFSSAPSRLAGERPLSHEYAVSLTASTEHLAAASVAALLPPPTSAVSATSAASSRPGTAGSSSRNHRRLDLGLGLSPTHDRARSTSHIPPAPAPDDTAQPQPPTTRTRRSKTTSSTALRPSAAGSGPSPLASPPPGAAGLWSRGASHQSSRSWSAATGAPGIREEGSEDSAAHSPGLDERALRA